MEAPHRKLVLLLAAVCATALLLVSCQTVPIPEPVEEPSTTPSPELKPDAPVDPEPDVQSEPPPEIEKPEPEPIPVTQRGSGIVKQAKSLGATASMIDDESWIIEKGDRRLAVKVGSRLAKLNETVLFLNEPFAKRKGVLRLADTDFEYVLKPAMDIRLDPLKSEIIVLDPGHGGSEPGTSNQSLGLVEKVLNLDVAVRLQNLLEALGYKVVLTRYNDRLVPLEERSKIANRSNAGLFVSIHFNAALNSEALGVETYALTPPGGVSSNDTEVGEDVEDWPGNTFDNSNFELAYHVQKALVGDLQRVDRGLKRARFKVLKNLECSGILVECGFLSHGQEALLVNTPGYRQKVAESLAKSIDQYVSQRRDS